MFLSSQQPIWWRDNSEPFILEGIFYVNKKKCLFERRYYFVVVLAKLNEFGAKKIVCGSVLLEKETTLIGIKDGDGLMKKQRTFFGDRVNQTIALVG